MEARGAARRNDGPLYPLPLPEEQGTGLGKPLKIIGHPVRDRIPIYVASLGEKNVALTAEVADGWLPVFFVPEKSKDVFGPSLSAGATERDPELGPLDICAGGLVCITDDKAEAESVRDLGRAMAALYIGGMGAKGQNFYNALARRYGYEQEAEEIQDLYLAGHKQERGRQGSVRAARAHLAVRIRRLHQGSHRGAQGGGGHRAADHAVRRAPGRDRREAEGLERVAARASIPRFWRHWVRISALVDARTKCEGAAPRGV